jgi:urea transporter
LTAPSYFTNNPFLDILYVLLNGISEVPLITAPLAGLLILAGVTLASRKAGFMMFISGLIGALVAYVLGADAGTITFGLFGYNSILTGMAFWSGPFVKENKATFLLSIIGAAVTAVTWMALANVLGNLESGLGPGYAIPGFTSSFIFTTWVIMWASKRYGYDIWPEPGTGHPVEPIHPAGLETRQPGRTDLQNSQVEPEFHWTATEFVKASLKGVSQVTFVENWMTGVFWVVGLTLAFEFSPVAGHVWTNGYTTGWNSNSPLFLAGVMAWLGSTIGLALSIVTKMPVGESRGGIHGFNQVLVMIAITSFLPLTWVSFCFAIFACVACSLFTMPALQRFFGNWGLPALTGPFVFTTWIFLLAVNGFGQVPAGIGWARP